MDRREFVDQSVRFAYLALTSGTVLSPPLFPAMAAAASAPASPEPVSEPHFPDRLHQFVWRNWELANTDRLAAVLGTAANNVLKIGASMGLPSKPHLTDDQLSRIYVTAIRQNWHVLPDEQLMELLGWDQARYDYALREDDFLWIKLGRLKPRCERLTYQPPSRDTRRRAAKIKQLIRLTLKGSIDTPAEPAFRFLEDLRKAEPPAARQIEVSRQEGEIDLSRGWTLEASPPGSGPQSVAAKFAEYLRAAWNSKVDYPASVATGHNVVRFFIEPPLADTHVEFEVRVEKQGIRVSGVDEAALRQAVYWLENKMEERQGPYLLPVLMRQAARLTPRFLYPYFALYGDALAEEHIDPLPDGYLEKLARAGVNGIWTHALLRNLAPSAIFPEFGEKAAPRLRTLRRLVDRAERHGIRIYLYLNEPRAMPSEFFAGREEIRGTSDEVPDRYYAMCTSTGVVRQWLSDSLAHVFAEVPRLGGVFCITASENLTNCFSHDRPQHCPRCSLRKGWEAAVETISALRDGVRRSSPSAKVIAWDWAWTKGRIDPADVIKHLPNDVALMSASEWASPINRGGFHTQVGEYSISVVGPVPRATQHWQWARQRSLSTIAKIQVNNTWEISSVPYIPVPNLVARHLTRLRSSGIDGLMLSWTLGGYPSPNLEVASECYSSSPAQNKEALQRVAIRRYGQAAAPMVLNAWTLFSEAFQEFPMESGALVYRLPTHHGPANLLRLEVTGYKASMLLFPYDDYKSWVGRYPVEVVRSQLEKLVGIWATGIKSFSAAIPSVPLALRVRAQKDLGVAETCYLHFKSAANQIGFYILRESLASTDPMDRSTIYRQMLGIAQDEITLASRQMEISKSDSTIGYEASNHYYYRPVDLLEKVVNCSYVIEQLEQSLTSTG